VSFGIDVGIDVDVGVGFFVGFTFKFEVEFENGDTDCIRTIYNNVILYIYILNKRANNTRRVTVIKMK